MFRLGIGGRSSATPTVEGSQELPLQIFVRRFCGVQKVTWREREVAADA
jgi:hypothetical protein